MEHLLVAWQVLWRYCPPAQNVFLGFHYLSSDVTWRVQTGLGLRIVRLCSSVQRYNCRHREQTVAMCVYKQSYECLYKAGALLKWFLPHNMPAWRGNHIPQPIVTFITFHLQLLPFTGRTGECQCGKKSHIKSGEGNLHNNMFIQGPSQREKFLQPCLG